MDKEIEKRIDGEAFKKLYAKLVTDKSIIKGGDSSSKMSSKYLAAIGETLLHFQDLEREIAEYIHLLIDTDTDIGRIITNEYSFKNLTNVLSTLMKRKRSGDESASLIIKEIRYAEELRNKFVHYHIWVQGTDSSLRIKYTNDNGKGAKIGMEEFTLSDIKKISGWVRKIGDLVHSHKQESFLGDFKRSPRLNK